MCEYIEAKMNAFILARYPKAIIDEKVTVLNGYCELCFLPSETAVDYFACLRRPDGSMCIVRNF